MHLRLRLFTAVIVSLASIVSTVPNVFAAGSMILLLVPHCTEETDCPEFTVTDATHITTGQLAAGDIIDLDVLIRGNDYANVRSVKSWIKYDAKVLEARSVELTDALPSPTPGEQTIDPSEGLVKIGGSTPDGFLSEDTRIARVTVRVLETSSDTELAFDGFNMTGNGNTAVNGARQDSEVTDEGGLPSAPCFDTLLGCGSTTAALLSAEPAKLTVKLTNGQSASSVSSVSSASSVSSQVSVSSSASSALTGQGSSFGLLQVQDVRVTSKDNVIFLSWQALKSSELAGYNVYYGTISGQYIQRRSLPTSSTSLVLRDLEPGVTYFLAVRAVSAQEEESVFSQEVSVTVGQPETASSPMTTLPPNSGAVTGNPIDTRGGTTINGETGPVSMFMWVLLGSAFIGTGFAFRRQLALSTHA